MTVMKKAACGNPGTIFCRAEVLPLGAALHHSGSLLTQTRTSKICKPTKLQENISMAHKLL
jgi:hypothetical protein